MAEWSTTPQKATVVVIDDLHWADPATLQVVGYLAARLAVSKSRSSKQTAQRVEAPRRAIADIEARKQRLIRTLERGNDPHGVLYREVREHLGRLSHEHETTLAELAVDEAQLAAADPCPDLLDQLPSDPIGTTPPGQPDSAGRGHTGPEQPAPAARAPRQYRCPRLPSAWRPRGEPGQSSDGWCGWGGGWSWCDAT